MKFHVRTYGCQMNVADSNEMGRHLQVRGLIPTEDAEEASILLVNTCTVRHHAEERAFSEIGRLKQWKTRMPGRKIVVTGCAAERTKEHLEDRFPHIDLVVGARSIENFGSIIDQLLEGRPILESLDYAFPVSGGSVSTFVTIMRGCNYSCTYCIVPSVRGRESYHPMEQILGEVQDRVREGAREITLLGQTVNSYQRNGSHGRGTDFADLLESVAAVDGVERIRFMSPHPHYMTDRVIEAMASLAPVCESLHLPVQTGSNSMLKRMLRNYSREEYLELIGKLRRSMPGMTLGTDIIVGFPGETEADFRATLALVEEARFDWGFIFKYSPREGTVAAQWDPLTQEIIDERHQECLTVVDRIAAEKREKMLGQIVEVLVEDENFGRTRANYGVRLAANAGNDGNAGDGTAGTSVALGDIVRARITSARRTTLEGVVDRPADTLKTAQA